MNQEKQAGDDSEQSLESDHGGADISCCVCVLGCFSHVQLFVMLWTVAPPQGSSVHRILQARIGVGCHALFQGIKKQFPGTKRHVRNGQYMAGMPMSGGWEDTCLALFYDWLLISHCIWPSKHSGKLKS